MSEEKKDEGLCGLAPVETGKWDPFWRDGVCQKHDERFTKTKHGIKTASPWVTFRDFALGVGATATPGAYAVIAAPLYLVFGGILGVARQMYLKEKSNDK